MKNEGEIVLTQKDAVEHPESMTEIEQILEKAYDLNDVGEFEGALEHCQQAIRLNYQLAEAYNLKGLILDQLGDKQEAIVAFQEAVHLNPEFQEAQQNLAEVQVEVHNIERKNQKLSSTWRMTKWGALSFGVAATVNEIIGFAWGMVSVSHLSAIFQSPLLELAIYSLTFAIIIGVAIAVLGSEAYNEAQRFGTLGTIGSGIVYFITGTIIYFYNVFASNLLTPIAFIIRFALMGGVLGILLGALRRNKKLMLWLALTGIIGWLFYGWRPLTVWIYSGNSKISSIFWNLFNGEAGFMLTMTGFRSLDAAIGGLVIGGLWGGVIGWFEAPKLLATEE